MNSITMRVYGRFAVAKGSKGSISLLFPNMEFGSSGFPPHTPLLTIPRHAIAPNTFPTMAPTFRLMGFGDPNSSEILAWNLSDLTVTFDAAGGPTLVVQDGCELVSLQVLENLRGRTAVLHPDSLTPSVTGRTKAAARITGATIFAKAAIVSPEILGFLTLLDARDGDRKNDKILWDPRPQVDLLEVVFSSGSPLTIRLTRGADTPAEIKVVANAGLPSLSITNVCNCLTQGEHYDLEFGQYYRLLQTVADDRLVPKEQLVLGEEADCDIDTLISYDE